jgi:ADP-ribose pyrophosphatase YjhB (NUDIX family)
MGTKDTTDSTDGNEVYGVIDQSERGRKDDYLYRISIKCLIRNAHGDVLVVKESGRTWWDVPGGGMDHGEDIETAITCELEEEIKFSGAFTFRVIDVDDPVHLPNANVLQVRIIFEITTDSMNFEIGEDADEIAFIAPDKLKRSDNPIERKAYDYVVAAGR